MRRILAALVLISLTSCASLGGARHVGTVSVVTAESTLGAVQDTEMLLVCDKPGAPSAPLCVPQPIHKQISAKLAVAFGLVSDLAKVIRAADPNAPMSSQVTSLLSSISKLIQDILALIPESQQKVNLRSKLEVK